jgi:acyl dehydratase
MTDSHQSPEVEPVTRLIDQERVDRYALAARDPNPIHTNEEAAKSIGLDGPLAHGMLLLALVSEAMTVTFKQRWAESGTLKVRWRVPAIPPVEVTAFAEPREIVAGVANYYVRCETRSGTVLLNGTASIDLNA